MICEEVYFYPHKRVSDHEPRLSHSELLLGEHPPHERSSSSNFPDYFRRVDKTMQRWMTKVIDHSGADVVVIPYPSYRSILPKSPRVVTVLELYDTDVLNWDMQIELLNCLTGKDRNLKPLSPKAAGLQRSFLGSAGLQISAREERCINSFDAAIALTESDHAMIQQLGHTITTCIPIMTETVAGSPDYAGGWPSMMLGPNYFNLQGLLHLNLRILPHYPESSPKSLRLNLYGSVPHGSDIKLDPRIKNQGFVPDISASLMESCFFVNPVFSGTGMQIKTVEAMAHGLAVVCYEEIAEAAGVRHGENGYVAKNEEDFASGIAFLNNDRRVAEQWGAAAKEHIATNLSQSVLDQKMSAFLQALRERFSIV